MPEPLFEEFGDGIKVTMFRKVSNATEKVSSVAGDISNALKKVGNTTEKVINDEQKESNTFDKYMPLFKEAEITEKFIKNIEQVFASCNIGVPFGQANVQEMVRLFEIKGNKYYECTEGCKGN